MSWRDRLQPASFKDVPFKVLNTEGEIGRRVEVHEFPFKDLPYVEDLGQVTDKFTITGYIVQNRENDFDYFNERDELISALKKPGPGTLVHPFLGILKVSLIEPARYIESFGEGGIVRFTMRFAKTSETSLYPSQTIDPVQLIDSVVATGLATAKEQFVDTYNVIDEPDWSITKTLNDANAFTQMLRNTISRIRGSVTSVIGTALSIISTVESALSDVINLPGDLADSLTQGFDSFLGVVGLFEEDFDQIADFDINDISKETIKSATSLLTDMATYGRQQDGTEVAQTDIYTPSVYNGILETIDINNISRARQAANRIAVVNYVRTNAILVACRIAIRAEYSSFDEANEIMLQLTDIIDAFLEKLGGDANSDIYTIYGINVEDIDTYNIIAGIRPQFISAMQQLGADLARVIEFEVPVGVMSTLELAYNQYEDIGRAEDIFQRNKDLIENPCFLPNQQIIEILSV